MRHVDSVGRKSYNRPFIRTLHEAAQKLPTLNEDSPGFVICNPPSTRYIPPARQCSDSRAVENHTVTTPTHNLTAIAGVAPRTGLSGANGPSLSGDGEASFGAAPSSAVNRVVSPSPLGLKVPNVDLGQSDLSRLGTINKALDIAAEALRMIGGAR